MDPLVSIIIPNHNGARWLDACLRSCLKQTYPRTQILVVDDASTDSSRDLIGRYGGRVTLIPHDLQKGPAAARNTGLKAASGEWIQFLDSDDFIAPDKLSLQVDRIRQDGSDLCVGGWQDCVTTRLGTLYYPDVIPDEPDKLLAGTLSDLGWIPVMCMLIRRDFLERVGPWREDMMWNEDRNYRYRILRLFPKISVVPRSLFYYRQSWSGVHRSAAGKREQLRVNEVFAGEVMRDLESGRLPDAEYRDAAAVFFCRLAELWRRYSPSASRHWYSVAARLGSGVKISPAGGYAFRPDDEARPFVWGLLRAGRRLFFPEGLRKRSKTVFLLDSWAHAWAVRGFHRLFRPKGRSAAGRTSSPAPEPAQDTPRSGAAVLVYHHVGPEENIHIRQLGVTTPPELFERQIAHLTRKFRVVPSSEFPRHVLDPNVIAVHFDDGYRSILDVALPILEKYGCPFKVYLNGASVAGRTVWLNKLSAVLSMLDDDALRVFAGTALSDPDLDRPEDVYRYWNSFDPKITRQAVDAAYERLGCSADSRKGLFLNEEDLRRLKDHPLIEWGSHGREHLPLDRLDPRAAEEEVLGGHEDLKAILGGRLDGYAVTFGTAKFRTPRIAALVSKIDRYFLSTTCGTRHLGKVGALPEIQRIPVEPGVSILDGIFGDPLWWADGPGDAG